MKNALLLVLLFSLLAASCYQDKRIICPAFDGKFLFAWFPYDSAGIELGFVSDSSDRDTLLVTDVVRGSAHQQEEYPCFSGGRIYLNTAKHKGANEYISISDLDEQYDSGLVKIFSFRFGDFRVRMLRDVFENTSSTQIEGYPTYSIAQHKDYVYHGKKYSDVVIISNNDTTTVNKVYVAKGYGVMGYRIHPSGTEYWLE